MSGLKIRSIFVVTVVMMLPHCGRVVDWGKKNFNQGMKLEIDDSRIRPYLKSVYAYDQLSTTAHFTVLWLSDEIRTTYAQLYARRLGKTKEQEEVMVRRQIEENNYFISLYVLSPYEITLGDISSHWSMFLRINDNNFVPIEVKTVELPPLYQAMFGKSYNQFQTPYLVKFDAKDVEDQLLIDENTTHVFLYFRSASRELSLCWPLSHGSVVSGECS